MRFVIWQTAFLGDLILTTPLVSSLKKLYPDSFIALISKPFGKEIFKNNPYLDELIIFDKSKNSVFSLIKKLKEYNFDIAISPHRSHRASYSLFLAKIPERIGFDKAGFSFLYTKKAKHRFDGTHEIDRNLKLLQFLPNYQEDKLQRFPQIFLTPDEDNFYKSLSLEKQEYIVVAPGSKWETKKWIEEGFKEVINYLSKRYKVVAIGGKEDTNLSQKILENLDKKNIINLTGRTNLRESFSIIKNAKALISNDSAPVHMAVAFGTPVVDIYGPTTTDLGFYPYRNGVVVEIKDLDCRPCGLHGHKACPEKHFKCMKLITPQMVINSLEKLLNRT
jgi:heptosyltransferase-2